MIFSLIQFRAFSDKWKRALIVARLGATVSAEFAFGTAVGLAYLLMSPPDLRVWQLTGNHRAMLFTRDSRRSEIVRAHE
jgi:hypothetical protein